MKVFFDHNMSPALARALRELFKGEHEVVCLAEKFERTATDIEWISSLSREGRWIVISGDRRITTNSAERAAFRNSRLVGMFLSRDLNKAPVTKKMERILAMWKNIESVSETVKGGAMFELSITGNRIKQLKN